MKFDALPPPHFESIWTEIGRVLKCIIQTFYPSDEMRANNQNSQQQNSKVAMFLTRFLSFLNKMYYSTESTEDEKKVASLWYYLKILKKGGNAHRQQLEFITRRFQSEKLIWKNEILIEWSK